MGAGHHDLSSARDWHQLVPFPAGGGDPALHVAARARLAGHDVEVEFRIDGPIAELVLPPPGAKPERRDGLWRSTCFEVFVGVAGRSSYAEFNLAPSGDWAAWTFASYRESPTPVGDVAPNPFRVERKATSYRLAATLGLPPTLLPPRADASGAAPSTADQRASATPVLELNLTTVLATIGGTLTYFALAHTRQQPDFHAPEARVLRLTDSSAAALAVGGVNDSSGPPCNSGSGSGRSRP